MAKNDFKEVLKGRHRKQNDKAIDKIMDQITEAQSLLTELEQMGAVRPSLFGLEMMQENIKNLLLVASEISQNISTAKHNQTMLKQLEEE